MRRGLILFFAVGVGACSGEGTEAQSSTENTVSGTSSSSLVMEAASSASSGMRPSSSSDAPSASSSAAQASSVMPPSSSSRVTSSQLEVKFLGVQGFILRRGDDVVLTAPLWTRASIPSVTLGSVTPDDAAIDEGLRDVPLDLVRAIITGHGHYDHLMDVPRTMLAAPNARLYGNRTARHILSAYAPDRPSTCGPPRAASIPRNRVIAVDDEAQNTVDYRLCPSQRPPGASTVGTWIDVPGAHVRLLPLCAEHPDQFLFFHFGGGSVDEDVCELPDSAAGWKEGDTVAFLVDFLDDDGVPEFRVYYQDAPTTGPVGHVPAEVLAEKAVDVILPCVGNYDQVSAQPRELVEALLPRFAISGHWEDFFMHHDEPQAIPFLNLENYVTAAEASMTGEPDVRMTVDGAPFERRHVMAHPGSTYGIARQP